MESGDFYMTSVDKRVVEMEFDNAQFEERIKQSTQSLKNLDANLKLQNGVRGFENVQRAADSLALDSVATGVDSIREKFSMMGAVAFTAIQRVTNAVIDMGGRVVRGVTIQPILDGLDEYTLKLNSIKTIQTNTLGKSSLGDINDTLDELNTYADKTIYNFAEMTRNIGTFTAAGVGLKQSAESIKGIANLAAASGSSSQQASVAMYQLSQAIAAGKVNLQDWNSVVNAGMGGKMFQNALIRTSKAFGGNVDEMIKKYGTFRESLSRGNWLTTEVLTKTLRNFTLFTNEMSEEEKEQARAMLRKEGYTKKQIAQIEKEAAAAEEAATKVKTFRQFIDTTKEELGSGWAKTWELIIGDLAEAENLWTSISNVVNGFIGGLAQSRNDTLQMWKDLKGRKALLKGFENVFNAFKSIAGPIAEAFNEIFKPIDGKTLADLSKKFKNFTKTLKVSDSTMQAIKESASGVFNTLSKGIGYVTSLASAIFKVIQPLASIGVKVFGIVVGGIASFIGAIGNISPEVDGVAGAFDFLATALSTILQQVSDGIPTFEDLKNVMDSIAQVVGGAASSLNGTLSSLLDGLFQNASNIKDSLGSIGKAIFKELGPIGMLLESLANTVGEFISNMKFTDIISAITALIGALGVKGIFGVLKSIKDIAGEAKGGFGISDMFDSIGNAFENFGSKIKFINEKTLIAIAVAIGILSASMVAISRLNFTDITNSLGAMTVLMGEMIGVMAALSAMDLSGKLKGTAAAFISISVSVAILASALKVLGSMSLEEMAVSVAALSTMLALLLATVGILGGMKGKMLRGAASIAVISTSMLFLAASLKLVASIPAENLFTAVGAIAASLTVLGVAMALFKSNIAGAASLLIVSVGLLALAGALAALGAIPIENIAVALGTLLSTLLILGVMAGIFSSVVPGMLGLGAALIVAGAGMLVLAGGMAALGSIPIERIAIAIGGLAATLIVLGAASAILGPLIPAMLGIGAALIVAGAGMLVLASGIAIMAAIPIEGLAAAIGGLAATLIVLGAASAILGPLIPAMLGIGAALIVAGAGMLVLASGIAALSSISLEGTVTAMASLAATLAVLGAASLLLAPSIPVLAGFGAILLVLGAGTMLAAIGIGMLVLPLSQLSEIPLDSVAPNLGSIAAAFAALAGSAMLLLPAAPVLASVASSMASMSDGLASMSSNVDGISETFDKLNSTIASNGPAISEAIASLKDSINASMTDISAIVSESVANIARSMNSSAEIEEAANTMVLALTASIISAAPLLSSAGESLGIALTESITSSIEGIGDAGRAIALSLLVSLAAGISAARAKVITAMSTLTQAILLSFKSMGPKVQTAAKNAALQGAQAIRGTKNSYISAGSDIGQGLVEGIRSKLSAAGSAGEELGRIALARAKAAVKSKSPSKEFMKLGRNMDEGLIIGIQALMDRVGDAGEEIGITAVNSTKNTLSMLSSIVDDIDASPTIRPVVDLTDVRESAAAISSIFSEQSAVQAHRALRGNDFYNPNSPTGTAQTKQINNTISINLDYSAGADANQIVRDIAAGLMNQAFMEG